MLIPRLASGWPRYTSRHRCMMRAILRHSIRAEKSDFARYDASMLNSARRWRENVHLNKNAKSDRQVAGASNSRMYRASRNDAEMQITTPSKRAKNAVTRE